MSPARPVLHAAVGWMSSMGYRLGSLGGGVCTVSGCCILAPGRLLQNGHLTSTQLPLAAASRHLAGFCRMGT